MTKVKIFRLILVGLFFMRYWELELTNTVFGYEVLRRLSEYFLKVLTTDGSWSPSATEMLQRLYRVFINRETGPHCIFLFLNLFWLTVICDICLTCYLAGVLNLNTVLLTTHKIPFIHNVEHPDLLKTSVACCRSS